MRQTALVLFGIGITFCMALPGWCQEPEQSVTHVAPAPSARFPASWYPADSNVGSTSAPTPDAPYTATMVITAHETDPATGQVKSISESEFEARDRAGRKRSDRECKKLDIHGASVIIHSIEVSDPVSHCGFRWMEPNVPPEKKWAVVTCMARTLHYSGHDDFRDPWVVQDTHPFPEQVNHTEQLGKRMFGDLEAVGYRHTKTTTNAQTGATHRAVTEAWYSPQLMKMLVLKQIPELGHHGNDLPDLELVDIHRGEPDSALFYPPAGYEIRVGH